LLSRDRRRRLLPRRSSQYLRRLHSSFHLRISRDRHRRLLLRRTSQRLHCSKELLRHQPNSDARCRPLLSRHVNSFLLRQRHLQKAHSVTLELRRHFIHLLLSILHGLTSRSTTPKQFSFRPSLSGNKFFVIRPP
jgi:hypothetical protein